MPLVACAFFIETLAAIASFRLGNMSMLQFLCVALRRTRPNFVDALSESEACPGGGQGEKCASEVMHPRMSERGGVRRKRGISHAGESWRVSAGPEPCLKKITPECLRIVHCFLCRCTRPAASNSIGSIMNTALAWQPLTCRVPEHTHSVFSCFVHRPPSKLFVKTQVRTEVALSPLAFPPESRKIPVLPRTC